MRRLRVGRGSPGASAAGDEALASARGFQLTAGILLALLSGSLIQLVPGHDANATVRRGSAAVSALWPQGWSFFDDEPRGPVVQAFVVGRDARPSAVDQLQLGASNAWGMSKGHLTRLVEMNTVAGAVPDAAWMDCGALVPADCLAGSLGRPPARVHDEAREPSLCGHVLLAVESPAQWTEDKQRWLSSWKILKVVNLDVTCGG